MKDYLRSLTWRRLNSRRIQSLLPYLIRSGFLPRRKPVRLPGKKHWRLLKTTRSSRRYSTVNVRTLPFFVRHVFGLNRPQNEHAPRDSLTFRNGATFRFRLAIWS